MRAVASAAVVAGLLVAAPARGDEAAGTWSPFDRGSGSRGRAMGGAFAAAGREPASITWNPAGLALVTRTGFEAAHRGADPGGVRESFAALAVPSWRWGTFAVSLRALGVDGIEPRDERNAVTGGDLAAAETEIAAGYARPLAPGWAAGATLRLARQSVAGFGAAALAGDLGVRVAFAEAAPAVPWLAPVAAGFAVRNALAPELRLDRDAVTDPRVWRAGVAWSGGVAGRPIEIALDLDGSGGIGPRLHAGAEVALHPLLVLRGGLDHGRLTAGAAVSWRDLDVGYAFEDGPAGTLHRFGLAHDFGPGTAVSRARALETEQRRFEQRLDAAFDERSRARIESLIGEAARALERGAHGVALDRLAAAALLDSGDARVPALLARTHVELGATLERSGDVIGAAVAYGRALAAVPGDTAAAAGAARSREAAGRRLAQDAERRERFRAALDALVRGDAAAARAAFARLAAADPGDSEAAAMRARAEAAAARQALDRLAAARRRFEAGATADATRLLAEARVLDPRAPGLAELAARLDAPAAAPAPAPAAAPGTRTDPREAAAMVRRGEAAMAAGRVEEAVRYFELALSLDPGRPDAARHLNREYLARGMDAFAAGRLEEAVGHWERARRADPADPRAAAFLARARERLERTREIFGERP